MRQSNTDKIEILNPEAIKLDLSYRGECLLTVLFTDQNNIEHKRHFLIRVFDEKPTQMSVSIVNENLESYIYLTDSSL